MSRGNLSKKSPRKPAVKPEHELEYELGIPKQLWDAYSEFCRKHQRDPEEEIRRLIQERQA